ncbi:MAG: RHS repeat protein [Spirochaetaceae bacterium]|nr:MAG: RHS repeat protein [Spirochaetaceae bacterium]
MRGITKGRRSACIVCSLAIAVATIALVAIVAPAMLGAGTITVTDSVVIPGYTVVRSSYTVKGWTSGPTRYTERGAYTETTHGGPNDGHVTHVGASITSEPAPVFDPGDTTETIPERVIASVPDVVETVTVSVAYDGPPGVDGPGALPRPADFDTPPLTEPDPGVLTQLPVELTATARDEVDRAIAAATSVDGLYAALVDGSTREANQIAVGDPVLIATGEVTVTYTDVRLDAVAVAMSLTRMYRSATAASGSLGPGWSWSLDTRIVFGTSTGARDAAIAVSLVADRVAEARVELTRRIDRAIGQRSDRIAQLAAAAAVARELERALRSMDYTGPLRDAVMSAARAQADQAASIARSLEAEADRLRGERTAIQTSIGPAAHAELDAILADISDRAAELHAAAAIADERTGANDRFASVSADPAIIAAGNDSVTVIGPDGRPRRFTSVAGVARWSDFDRFGPIVGLRYESAEPGDAILVELTDRTWALIDADRIVWRYGVDGELRSVVDRNGNAFEFHYDDAQRLSHLTDTRSREIGFDRDDAGRVVRIIAPESTKVAYAYAGGTLTEVTDRLGALHRYEYDVRDGQTLLTRAINPDGTARTYRYDRVRGVWRATAAVDEAGYVELFDVTVSGRALHTSPAGRTTEYRYDAALRLIEVIHPDGSSERTYYDARGNPVRHRAGGDAVEMMYERSAGGRDRPVLARHDDGSTERWSYADGGALAAHIDRRGNATRYSYDAHGNLARVDYPDGTIDRYDRVAPGVAAAGELSRWIDRRGNVFSYEYDAFGHLLRVRDSIGLVATYQTDRLGRVVATTDAVGRTVRVTYRADGTVSTIVGPDDHAVEYSYGDRGQIIRVVDNGRETTFDWDERMLLRSVIDAAGDSVAFEYDADGLPIAREVRSGSDSYVGRTEFEYDARGRVTLGRDVETRATERYEYDHEGRITAVTDPVGHRVEYRYNADGLPVEKSWYIAGVPRSERFDYDPGGVLRGWTDPRGSVWRSLHDVRSRTTRLIDPDGITIDERLLDPYGAVVERVDGTGLRDVYRYDLRGRLVEARRGALRVALYEYDAIGRMTAFVDAEGARWSMSYDRDGAVSITDPEGGIQTNFYRPDGQLSRTIDPNGLITRFEYDPVGRLAVRVDPGETERRTEYGWHVMGGVATITDAEGRTRRFEYNTSGQLVSSVGPLGAATVYARDAVGRVVMEIDPTGRQVSYRYDPTGQLLSVWNGDAMEMLYEYDAAGNLIAQTDGAGRLHRYQVDHHGRVIAETAPNGAIRRISYDSAGRVESVTDFAGITAINDYDAAGRLVSVRYSDGTQTAYRYDRAGRVIEAANQHDRVELVYDRVGRLTGARSDATGNDIAYQYDRAGRLLIRSDRYAGTVTAYEYDRSGMLSEVVDSAAGRTTVSYDRSGLLTGVLHPNGVGEEMTRDAAGRIHATTVREPRGAVLFGVAHVYDDAGRRIFDIDSDGAVTGYRYDATGRLSRVQYPLAGPKRDADLALLRRFGVAVSASASPVLSDYLDVTPDEAVEIGAAYRAIGRLSKPAVSAYQAVWTESFAYNGAGDRIEWRTDAGAIEYTYDGSGRLARAGATAYAHDVAGNLIGEHSASGRVDYRYNAQNRLAHASLDATTVTYAYDALGRRIARTESGGHDLIKPPGATLSTVYRYDGVGHSLSSRSDWLSAMPVDPGELVKPVVPHAGRYTPRVPGSGQSGWQTHTQVTIGSRAVSVAGVDGVSYLHHDATGSLHAATGSGGVLSAVYRYDAFGSSLTAPSGPHGFSGKRVDGTTGLIDFGFRDYDPVTGRFTTRDPVRDGFNWYTYVNGDPVNHIDRLGLAREPVNVTLPAPVTRPPVPVASIPIPAIYLRQETPAQRAFGPFDIVSAVLPDPGADLRALLMLEQDRAMSNPLLAPGAGGPAMRPPNPSFTWCNQAVCDIAEGVGIDTRYLTGGKDRYYTTANEIGERLAMQAGWVTSPDNRTVFRVTAEHAQDLANRGEFAVATWINPTGASGHVATIRPHDGPYDPTLGPLVADVGRRVHVTNVSEAFAVGRVGSYPPQMGDVVYYHLRRRR